MHIVLGIVGMGVLIVLVMLFKDFGKARDEATRVQLTELKKQLSTLLERQEDMEKRLKNVELIVTDSRFTELPEAREAIDLKRQMEDLKTILNKMTNQK